MPRLLNRYIFTEVCIPFLLTLSVLTLTALLSKVVKLVELTVVHGAGLGFIAGFIASALPSFLVYTIPVSFLVAVLVAFTRLSSESEIIAMKASGISLFTLARPVAVAAVLAYAAALVITLYLFPWGNLNLKAMAMEAARGRLAAGLEEKTFYDRFNNVVFYVDRIDAETGEMHGLFISEQNPGGPTNVFFAREGVFSPSDGEGSVYLKLTDGTVHRQGRGSDAYGLMRFSNYVLELGLPSGRGALLRNRSNRELYTSELVERARKAGAAGRDASPYIIDLHKRFALPASIFVFALIGVPLGLQRVRSSRLAGFSLSLGVMLAYYVTSTALEAAGEYGHLNAIAAVWGSDVIFALVGAYIFVRAARDRPFGPARLFSRRPRVEKGAH